MLCTRRSQRGEASRAGSEPEKATVADEYGRLRTLLLKTAQHGQPVLPYIARMPTLTSTMCAG